MWTHRRSGQTNQRRTQDHRNPYERDRTRVIHCPAFRRLQRKTQILGTDNGDFHRTRLTHSLEVASIGSSVVHNIALQHQESMLSALFPHDDLIQAICLLHDIGHPPFGHGGEVALNYMMREHGGFEGNAQTLRLLTKIENSYGNFGLDLTRRTLLGILKYPVPRSKVAATSLATVRETYSKTLRINDWLPPKAYFDSEQPEVDWLLMPFEEQDRILLQSLTKAPQERSHGKSAFHSFDCSIMDVADDIAYGVHDLEDAIHLQLINRSQLDTDSFRTLLKATPLADEKFSLVDNLFSNHMANRKQAIGEMVNYLITSAQIEISNPAFENHLLKYNVVLKAEASALLNYLIQAIFHYVIDSQDARTFEYGGQMVVLRLFEAISSNPSSLLDNKYRELYREAGDDEAAGYRVICDYIANMTDEFAYHMHEKLFGLNTGERF